MFLQERVVQTVEQEHQQDHTPTLPHPPPSTYSVGTPPILPTPPYLSYYLSCVCFLQERVVQTMERVSTRIHTLQTPSNPSHPHSTYSVQLCVFLQERVVQTLERISTRITHPPSPSHPHSTYSVGTTPILPNPPYL